VFVGLGLTLNPMYGAAAMSLSSFCVVSNALRLNLFRLRDGRHDRALHPVVLPDMTAQPGAKVLTMYVSGMMCQHCVATVTKVLKAMDGVTDAVVDLDGQKADVSADKAISAEDFKKVITTAGYTLKNLITPKKEEDETMEKTLKIEGMMCQHCQKHVHDALAAMDGVTAVTVDLEGKKADVTTSKDIPTEDFAKVIADAGYELVK